jgi:hypothetical protein
VVANNKEPEQGKVSREGGEKEHYAPDKELWIGISIGLMSGT